MRALALAALFLAACHAATTSPPDAGAFDAGQADSGFTWRKITPCPLARFEAMGVAVDGKLLVMGGFTDAQLHVTRRVDAYEPATDTWSRRADLPGAQTHAGVALDGTRVWLVGGFIGWPATTSNEVWSEDVGQDVWQSEVALPAPRGAMATMFEGHRLHAIGGLAADGQTDTGAHQVLVDGGWTNAPDLPNPRNHLGGALADGVLVVTGGRHGWDEASGQQDTTSVFDLATLAWRSGDANPVPRSEIAASTFALGNKVVVIGGSTTGVKPVDAVSLYDPATDTWTELPPLPSPRKGAVAAVIGNQLVVTTGSPTSTDPDATTWVGCCIE